MVHRQLAASDNAVCLCDQDERLRLVHLLGERGCIDALAIDEVGLSGPARSTLFSSIGRLNEVDNGRDVLGGGVSEPDDGHDGGI